MSVFIPNVATTYLSTPFTLGAGADLTLMCWTYLSTASPAAYRNMIYASPNTGLSAYTDGVTFDVGTSATTNLGAVLPINTWIHVCQTVFSNGNASSHLITGYINGQQTVRVVDTTTLTTYADIGIGGDPNAPGGTFPLNGNVRDARVWTRALSATEVVGQLPPAQGWWLVSSLSAPTIG